MKPVVGDAPTTSLLSRFAAPRNLPYMVPFQQALVSVGAPPTGDKNQEGALNNAAPQSSQGLTNLPSRHFYPNSSISQAGTRNHIYLPIYQLFTPKNPLLGGLLVQCREIYRISYL